MTETQSLRDELERKDIIVSMLRDRCNIQNTDIKELRARVAELEAQEACHKDALLKLACLGNGDRYGNSDGNVIAIRALGLNPAAVYMLKP